MKYEIENMGFKVHTVNMDREIKIIKDIKSYIEIKKYIKDTKPDIVYLHSSKAWILGRLASFRCKVPCTYNALRELYENNGFNILKDKFTINRVVKEHEELYFDILK